MPGRLTVDLSIKFVMDGLALQQHGSFRVDRVGVFYLRELISTSVTWRHLGLRFESDYRVCNLSKPRVIFGAIASPLRASGMPLIR